MDALKGLLKKLDLNDDEIAMIIGAIDKDHEHDSDSDDDTENDDDENDDDFGSDDYDYYGDD